MKPTKLLLALILLISISSACAEEIKLEKSVYWLGETVQAEITMQDFSLSKLSLLDNKSSKVPVGFITQKLADNDYAYFNLPTDLKPGKYYLTAKDQRIINGVLTDFTLSTELTVIQELGISVDPAIVTLDPLKNELKISLHNYAGKTITANISTTSDKLVPARADLQIEPATTRNAFISYDYASVPAGQSIIIAYQNRTYTIKVLTAETQTETIEPTTETPESQSATTEEIKFQARGVNKEISRYTSLSDPLTVKNTVKKELHKVEFATTGNLAEIVLLKIQSIERLDPESQIDQYIWANRDKNSKPGIYEGDLKITSQEGYSDAIHLKIAIQELTLIEEQNATKPNLPLFNKTSLKVLINETQIKEEPNVRKNVTIALIMLAIVSVIGIIISIKLRKKTRVMRFNEYVRSVKKNR